MHSAICDFHSIKFCCRINMQQSRTRQCIMLWLNYQRTILKLYNYTLQSREKRSVNSTLPIKKLGKRDGLSAKLQPKSRGIMPGNNAWSDIPTNSDSNAEVECMSHTNNTVATHAHGLLQAILSSAWCLQRSRAFYGETRMFHHMTQEGSK